MAMKTKQSSAGTLLAGAPRGCGLRAAGLEEAKHPKQGNAKESLRFHAPASSFDHFVAASKMVHLRRLTMATMMMAMVGVVAGSGLVCMHSSSDSKEMADRKCALAFEDKKVCERISSTMNATCQTFSAQICKAARKEHNEKCIDSWKLTAGSDEPEEDLRSSASLEGHSGQAGDVLMQMRTEYNTDCSDLSDVSSKASMQTAGWSFSFTHADGHGSVGPHCGNGANWYGWSGGNNVGTLTSPALHGSGTATVEFGNCWNAGNAKLYLNDVLIDTAATNGQRGRAIQSKTFAFQAGDVVKLKDEDGNAVLDLKSFTINCAAPTTGTTTSVSFKQDGQSGYLHDTGAAFGTHNDHEYGWMCDGQPEEQTAGVRSWGNHFDRNNACSGTTTWQMKVPNGAYNIKVTLPKDTHAGCKVQGESTGGADGNFVYEKNITVTDGTVTVSGDYPACHSIEAVVLSPPFSGCAFSDLVLPSGASASGPNCTAGGTVAHGAACTVSSGSPDHPCSDAQCTDGSWTSPTCFLWNLQNLFTCSTQGSNCESWWGATQRAERGYTHSVYNRDACGRASKMLFAESPYDRDASPVYDATFKGYTMQKATYENGSPSTGTKEKEGWDSPKKYGFEQDPIAFSDTAWLDTGGCVADAPSCVAGFNYDPGTGMCADSASGWNSTTPAAACGFAQHKCNELKVYYQNKPGLAVLPLTEANQRQYQTTGFPQVYTFTYVFKKWMECTAKNVHANSSGTAAEPDGWNCKVEKRCVCLSCTMGSETDEPGDNDYTGEPCSCDATPVSVQARAGLQCAQT